jgi:hypothetical protein
VKPMSNRYFNELFRLNCASDILALKLFPNVKEFTESMAAYNAVRSHLVPLGICLNDPDNILIAIGDGCTPRTAALFAFRTKWNCYSIDPALREQNYSVNRLNDFAVHVEKFNLSSLKKGCKNIIIVLVHSHAPMKAVLNKFRSCSEKLHIVAIPCCVEQNIPNKPYIGYQDTNILSPKNEVRIWVNV